MTADRWITFDCFGTLVDWHTGFAAAIAPLAGSRTDDVLEAYHRVEPQLEREAPHRPYKDVLEDALLRAAEEVGVPLTGAQARLLPQWWARMPVFDDVEPMLAELRDAGYRLGALTNCDEDLFARTAQSFRKPFDLVITAERVRDYKPSHTHFNFFWRSTGAAPEDWIHVACSWFHDIAPAGELGIARVWIDRDRTGQDPATATRRVETARDVAPAIAELWGSVERA